MVLQGELLTAYESEAVTPTPHDPLSSRHVFHILMISRWHLYDGHRHLISCRQEMNNAQERAARQDPTAAHGAKARCLLVHDVATKPGEEERFEFHVDCEVV